MAVKIVTVVSCLRKKFAQLQGRVYDTYPQEKGADEAPNSHLFHVRNTSCTLPEIKPPVKATEL